MRSKPQCKFFFLLLAALFFSGACGKKTMPVPPPSRLPAPISDLGYSVDTNGITLRWSQAVTTTTGKALSTALDYQVLRAEVAADGCVECPLEFVPLTMVSGTEQPSASGLFFQDTHLTPGNRYFYKVQPKTGLLSALDSSNQVSFTWHIPVGPPRQLELEVGDTSLSLSWQPPSSLATGDPVQDPVAYQVLRSAAGLAFQTMAQVDQCKYLDTGLVNGVLYSYKIRAVLKLAEGDFPGQVSAVVQQSPRDLTPPPAPWHLRIIQTSQGVKILWDLVDSEDLVGFRVYRRLVAGEDAVLLGETGPAEPVFYDQELPAARQWYYFVTAIDDETPPNESKPVGEVLFVPSR